MWEQLINFISSTIAPLGFFNKVTEIFNIVSNSIGIYLFTSLMGFVLALIIVRILLKVL